MLLNLKNKNKKLSLKKLDFKTIHEYFNQIWLEHSKNNMYSSISPSYKLRQSSIKSNMIQEILASNSMNNYIFIHKNRRYKKKPFKRIARSRRIYNKINSNFKFNRVNNVFKRRLLLRFRIRNINPIRAFYFNVSIINSNVFRSSIKISRNFILRKKRYRFARRSRKKKILLIKSKSIRNNYFLTKKKKIRLFKIRRLRNSLLSKNKHVHLDSKNKTTSSLYRSVKSYKLAYNSRVPSPLKFPRSSFFLRKYKKLRRYIRLKKLKLNKKKMYTNSFKFKILEKKTVSTESAKNIKSNILNYRKNLKKDKPYFKLSKLSLKISNLIGSTKLSYLSIFLKYRLLILNLNFKSEKFLMKKLLFSFLKPNEAKKSIMNRRKKIQVSRLYRKIKQSQVASNTLMLSKSKLTLITNKMYNSSTNSHFKTYTTRTKNSYELFLPRVKFKPGYQRLWRQSRKAMADNIGLKYIYQKQMTKYMLRLSRRVYSYSFAMSESSVDKAILYSRLLPDLKTINDFLSNGLISLNGWQINNLKSFVLQGDFIQLTISKWLSIYFRWLVTWAKVNKAKFKNLVFRKGLASSYKLMKQRKQRSQYVPLWVYNSRFDISDIKPNFEVDYFTMSSVMLYEPLLIDYYTPDDLPDHRHYIYRLYNWKYIT